MLVIQHAIYIYRRLQGLGVTSNTISSDGARLDPNANSRVNVSRLTFCRRIEQLILARIGSSSLHCELEKRQNLIHHLSHQVSLYQPICH
jgi:hypothetical protein